MNKALCFFIKASSSEIEQLADLEGNSCFLSSYPTNYNFLYKGTTESSETSSTIIYFMTNKNLTTDPSVDLFKNNYEANNSISAASLSLAQSSFSVDYIQTSVFLTTFDPMTAIAASTSTFSPTFSHGSTSYSSTSR